MKLIIGKKNIENYELHILTTKPDTLNGSNTYITWRAKDGIIYPALIIYEKSDFSEIVYPNDFP